MNMCRTCLETPAEKDVSDLEMALKKNKETSIEIMMFCLGIEITRDSKITTNLCVKCYRKIISMYKFKLLSLKNEAYLKSLDPVVKLADQVLTVYTNNSEAKHENVLESNEFGSNFINDYNNTEIKLEIVLKHEEILNDVNSDENLLSLDQKIKYEYIEIENEQIFKKRAKRKKENTTKKNIRNKGSGSKNMKSHNVGAAKKRQVCEKCGMSVLNLAGHSTCHQPKEERQTLQCKACPKLFCTYGGLSRHYKSTHLGIRAICDICNKEFSKAGLAEHIKRKHNPSAMRFKCVMCEKHFVSKYSLKSHMVKHTRQRPFECDICHKSFYSKSNISTHIRQVHFNEKNFQCELCPRAFFERNALLEHSRTHTRERVFKCDDCEKSFWTKNSLWSHRISHRDTKNYHCEVCEKSFLRLSNLRSHMVTHTKEKRYPCQFCGVRFGRSEHRVRHERKVHKSQGRRTRTVSTIKLPTDNASVVGLSE